MRPEDRRYHTEGVLAQVTPDRTPFSSREATAKIIENWRTDLIQLLGFGRITEEEYMELDARYAKLAEQYPLPQS